MLSTARPGLAAEKGHLARASGMALGDAGGEEEEAEMVTQARQASEGATEEGKLTVSLKLEGEYRFEADFGLPGVQTMTLDEPAPLGEGAGPNPARLLAVAVADCLASSLLFCLRKARIEAAGMEASAVATMARNEKGLLRVSAIDVTLRPSVAAADIPRMNRCLEVFEDFCPVTPAIRQGVDVSVAVAPFAID
jgi:organic hydroperoxide reductase OsmC/OhrA